MFVELSMYPFHSSQESSQSHNEKRQWDNNQLVQAPSGPTPQGDPWEDLTHSHIMYNSSVINNAVLFDPNNAHPYPAYPPPSKSDHTLIFHANQTNTTVFNVASKPLKNVNELDFPILFQNENLLDNHPDWLIRLKDNTVVDVIIQNAQNALFPAPAEPPHPIHLHGHKYWVLGSKEYDNWNYSSIDDALKHGVQLNLVNPPSRDTFLLPTSGWLALRFVADNPGAWLMHCHSTYGLQLYTMSNL